GGGGGGDRSAVFHPQLCARLAQRFRVRADDGPGAVPGRRVSVAAGAGHGRTGGGPGGGRGGKAREERHRVTTNSITAGVAEINAISAVAAVMVVYGTAVRIR